MHWITCRELSGYMNFIDWCVRFIDVLVMFICECDSILNWTVFVNNLQISDNETSWFAQVLPHNCYMISINSLWDVIHLFEVFLTLIKIRLPGCKCTSSRHSHELINNPLIIIHVYHFEKDIFIIDHCAFTLGYGRVGMFGILEGRGSMRQRSGLAMCLFS